MRKKKTKSKRKLKIICKWIIVSFVIQTGVLFYLSNYYFTDKTKVTFKTINQIELCNKNDITIPKGAKKINLSPSGRYATYYLENTLHVINLVNGKDNVVDLEENLKDTFVKWYEAEDKLIILEKKEIDDKAAIKIYTYEAKDDLKQAVLDFNNKSRLYKLPTSTSKVDDIQLNTLNTIVYIKSSDYNSKNINRLDISAGIHKLPIDTDNIEDYYIIKQQDQVVFDNILNKKVFLFNSQETKEIVIDGVDKSKLLYVDNNGIVYIGQLDNDKVKAIYYKNYYEKDNNNWEKIQLEKPLEVKDIHIFSEEHIYYVDNINGMVINLKNKKKTKFIGEFVDMNCNSIMSLKDQKVVLSNLK